MSEAVLTARRALYLALTQHLEKGDAIDAVELWVPADGPAGNPLSGLRRYCHLVAERFGLQGKEAELHLSILRSMKGQGIQSPAADPNWLGAPDTGPATFPQAASAPYIEPTAHLVQRLLETVERSVVQEAGGMYSPQKWRDAIVQASKRVKPANVVDLHNWLSGKTTALQVAWPPREAGTHLVNAVYVVLAQWLGPVKADACFMRVVQQFEASEDPLLRSIRNYL